MGALDVAREHRPSVTDTIKDPPPIPSRMMRRLSLGFTSTVADIWFLAAIQIYGDKAFTFGTEAAKTEQAHAIFHSLDYSTDLDPRFAYAYVFGGLVIPVLRMDGGAANVDLTLKLLEKGTRNAPGDWRIPFHAAYLRSTFTGDFAGAAIAMGEAARRPGHPAYVPLLAARLAAQGGAIETGLAMTRAMLANAENEAQREQLSERLTLLLMEKALRELDSAVAHYRIAHGRTPGSLQDLVDGGDIAAIPAEPHGGTFLLDASSGAVRSSAAPRLKLPDSILRDVRRNVGAQQDPE